jgi:hypothetical protein
MESDLSSFVKQRHNFREALFLKKQKKRHAQPHSLYHHSVALIIYLCSIVKKSSQISIIPTFFFC